jgi:hypothetical protein
MGWMIFMGRLLACMEMTNAASREGHAADEGVIVLFIGWDDEQGRDIAGGSGGVFYQRVGERFSSRMYMPCTR